MTQLDIRRLLRTFSRRSLLLFGTCLCLSTQAIAPQRATAYIARVDLTIDRLSGETYQNIVHRAESIARTSAQRSFDQDILVTDVSIIVSAQNLGDIVPVLALKVSRTQWKKLPDPRRWATYLTTAQTLLLWGNDSTSPNTASTSTSSPSNLRVPDLNNTQRNLNPIQQRRGEI
jgi:hypothetical protein